MDKDKKVKEQEELAEGNFDKRDFMKTLGLGLGAVGLGTLAGAQAFAEMEKKGKYVVVITHGGNNPHRAILALILAQLVADKGWGQVNVWSRCSPRAANPLRIPFKYPVRFNSEPSLQIFKQFAGKGD